MLTGIEKVLYRLGFHVPEVRRMILMQALILMLALPALMLGRCGLDFLIGTCLGTLNFLALARIVQDLVFLQRGALAVQLLSFYGRLLLTGVALYLLIVVYGASVAWLLAGLSSVLIMFLLWGMTHFLGKNSKEA